MTNNRFKYFLYFSIILFFCTQVYAIITLRPIQNETANWLYHVIQKSDFFFMHHRFFSTAMQTPTLIILKLLPPNNYTLIASQCAYAATYTLLPIISLLFCYFILKRRESLHLLYFPLLSLPLIIFSTSLVDSNVTYHSVSLFWPLFLLIHLGVKSRSELLMACFISLCLAMSYEISILFFVFLLFLTQYKLKRKEISNTNARVLSCLFGLGIFYLIYVLMKFWVVARAGAHLDNALMNSYFYLGYLSKNFWGILFLIICFSINKIKERSRNINIIIYIAILLVFLFELNQWTDIKKNINDIISYSFWDRIFVIPKTIIMAILCLFSHKHNYFSDKKAISFLISIFIVSAFADYQYSKEVIKSKNKLMSYKDGCSFIKNKDRDADNGLLQIAWAAPYSSILFQKKIDIDKVIFITNSNGEKDYYDSCKKFEYDRFILNDRGVFLELDTYKSLNAPIKFDKVLPENKYEYVQISNSNHLITNYKYKLYDLGKALSEEYTFQKGKRYRITIYMKPGNSFEVNAMISIFNSKNNKEIKEVSVNQFDNKYEIIFDTHENMKARVMLQLIKIDSIEFNPAIILDHISIEAI